MSAAALFAAGCAVTLIVAAGLALLVYGAILDGRELRRRRLEPVEAHVIPIAADDRRTAA